MSNPDPSLPAIRHVDTEIKRVNDVLTEVIKKIDSDIAHVKEIQEIQNAHAKELREAQTSKIESVLSLMQKGTENDIKVAIARAEALAVQFVEYSHRVSALELYQSKDTGRSGISTQLIIAIAIVVGGIIGGIVMAYFHTAPLK